MSRPDDGLLHAWLDGELEAAEAARVETLVAEDAEWAAAAAEARGVMAASSRILRALDVVPGDVIPRGGSAAPVREERRGPPVRNAVQRVMPTWIRMAAVFAFVAGVGYLGRAREEEAVPALAPATAASAAPATAPARASDPQVAAREILPPPPAAPPPAQRSTAAATNAASPVVADAAATATARATMEVEKVETTVVAAPAPAAAAMPERGVAGGIARDLVRRAPERTLASPNAIAVIGAEAGRAKGADAGELTGCWRIATTTATAIAADTIQRALAITAGSGDTLLVQLTPRGVTARVMHVAPDTLRGTAPDAPNRSIAFVATRMTCPASP